MNQPAAGNALTLSIGAVERDTGLSKDTLRVWERRYGFPMPTRDPLGERAYPLPQVDKLRLLKRLLDVGHRPGRVVPLSLDELQTLSEQAAQHPARRADAALPADELQALLALIHQHDPAQLRRALTRQLSRAGVAAFVTDVLGPLNRAVGDAWVRGQLEVFEEHLYSEVLQGVLRAAIASVPDVSDASDAKGQQALRVLLSTAPGEPHGLGLLMAEALLALEGCRCTSLGTETPLLDLVQAAAAVKADVVALSFTGCLNANQVADGLTELRQRLPLAVQLWVGGTAPVLQRRPLPGVQVFADFRNVAAAVSSARRSAHP